MIILYVHIAIQDVNYCLRTSDSTLAQYYLNSKKVIRLDNEYFLFNMRYWQEYKLYNNVDVILNYNTMQITKLNDYQIEIYANT